MTKEIFNNIEVNFEVEGPNDAETLLLVHGFPDSLKLWRNVKPLLLKEGFRVIAIDMPGFGDSAIPEATNEMRVDNICDVMQQLLRHLKVEKIHLVGHDWGAGVCWHFAYRYPDLIKSYTALSVGHPKSYLAGGPEQLLKAWYIVLILNRELAEYLFSADDWSLFKNFFGYDGLDEYWLPDLQRPGRLTSAFNIYRANLMPGHQDAEVLKNTGNIKANVLAMFGEKDLSLTYEQMELSSEYVEGSFDIKKISDAHHWLPLKNHEEITPYIVEFVRANS